MPDSRSSSFDFLLPAGGEMGQRIREFDWAQTPLGPPDGWPAALKTALNMMLCARFPMFLAWGEALIYFYNDAFIDILAARHPDALGCRFSELAPEAWEAVSVLVDQALAGQPVFHKDLPFQLRRKGYDETAWFTVSYSPVCDDGNRIRGVLGVCMETTQRINEDKARHAELSWLRDMFEQAPVPIAVFIGPDHRYEISNAANQELLGNRPVLGLPVREVLPEAEEQGIIALLDRIYSTGEPFSGRDMGIRYRRADGTPALVYMNVIYQPIHDLEGEIIGIFAVANETTQAVTATRALKASEERLRGLVDAVPQMVWSAAPDGTNKYFNKQWYDFTGLPEGSLDGWKAVHPDDRADNTVHWEHCVATGSPYEVKNRLRHRSGEYRWTLVRALPVRDEHGRIEEWIGSNIDIHAQEVAVEALKSANRRKDEFLAMLAHELRNPLAPISAAADLLSLRAGSDPQLARASSIIGRQVAHIVHLVDDLLDASRVTRGLIQLDSRPVDLKQVIGDAIEQVRPVIEQRRHRFTLDLGADAVYVLGDHNRLVQILVNLLDNAAKYTPDAGHVELMLKADVGAVSLSVCDSGIGMTPELVRHAFELFYQGQRALDRTQGGLGIGLALVKSLAELHGGSVAAESSGPGQGSRFRLTLPRQAPADRPVEAPETAAQPNAGGLRVLVVDDNADAALTVALLLETMGHEAIVEHSASAALDRHGRGAFDLYILDIGLPGMSGYELASRLRASGTAERALFVALSGYGQEQDREASARAGFNVHLVKPANLRQLQELLGKFRVERR